jgi:hypothetical protein
MKLRPYQLEIARAVMDSIENKRGLTFSVEIARQGGKNELSAHIEVLLLTMFMSKGGSAIKCSPTFKPQTVISMSRLKQRLDDFGFDALWYTEMGYIVKLGSASQIFLSAEESSSVVGHTADILLEIDESQDVNKDKYTKEFRPMASSTNATTVHYGTTWDDSTLLEQIKQSNLEQQKSDGIKRHFRFDWQEVAKYNPSYRDFVEAERYRLGEFHPLFLSQYALLPIRSGGGFFNRSQIAMLQGNHPRLKCRESENKAYVAGIDVAGASEVPEKQELTVKGRDATVITIAEVIPSDDNPGKNVQIRVVEHYIFLGVLHNELSNRMISLLGKHGWNCSRIVVDATGVGESLAFHLWFAMRNRVTFFKFTQASKSRLGFNLLAAVNSGSLKIYPGDGSYDHHELMFELERARSVCRPNQTINFFVDPSEGHDDYLISLALVVEAASQPTSRKAIGTIREE